MPAPPQTTAGERIGARIVLARKSAGLTQEELGSALGYKRTAARQMIHQLESGRVPSAWLRLAALSKVTGASADWILGEGPTLPPPSSGDPPT